MEPLAWMASTVFAGNDLTTWAVALVALVLTASAVLVLRRVLPRWVRTWAATTTTGLDDLAADVLSRTQPFFAVGLGLLAALSFLTLPPATEDMLRRVVVALGVVQGGLWAMGLVQHGIERYAQRADPLVGNATGVLRVLSLTAVWAVVLLLLLANLGVDVTAGIAGLGVGGIAVALAMQNILGDLFASLSIVFDRPFGIGDFVVVGDHSGTVENIGIKTTRIRSLTGEQLVLSNSDLLGSRIRNFKDMRERRVVFTIGVGYDTPPATLRKIPAMLRETVTAVPGTRFDRGHFFRFGESSLDFEVVWFWSDGDYGRYMDAQQAIYFEILDRLTEAGVDIPFPQRTVWLKDPRRAPRGTAEQERALEAVS